MLKKNIIVYTDGSCSGNGKKNSVGGIGIHFPNEELKDVSKVYRYDKCTNQKTELYAILMAIKYIDQFIGLETCKILIKTDSQYSIDCITKWVYGWEKNNWMTKNHTPVANREFIEPIHKYYEKYNIVFDHVDAHTNNTDNDSIGNAMADKLATMATQKAQSELNLTKKSSNKSTNKPAYKNETKTMNDNKIIVELINSKK